MAEQDIFIANNWFFLSIVVMITTELYSQINVEPVIYISTGWQSRIAS